MGCPRCIATQQREKERTTASYTKLTRAFETQGKPSIKVTYTKASKANGRGRWFAKHPGAMQGMKRQIRHTICKGLWIDLDFVNCHPVLLSKLCKNLGYASDLRSEYS